jgi:hypothetical protein
VRVQRDVDIVALSAQQLQHATTRHDVTMHAQILR